MVRPCGFGDEVRLCTFSIGDQTFSLFLHLHAHLRLCVAKFGSLSCNFGSLSLNSALYRGFWPNPHFGSTSLNCSQTHVAAQIRDNCSLFCSISLICCTLHKNRTIFHTSSTKFTLSARVSALNSISDVNTALFYFSLHSHESRYFCTLFFLSILFSALFLYFLLSLISALTVFPSDSIGPMFFVQ